MKHGFWFGSFALNSDRKQYKLAIVPIDFFVVKSDGMNAFCTVSVKPIKRI